MSVQRMRPCHNEADLSSSALTTFFRTGLFYSLFGSLFGRFSSWLPGRLLPRNLFGYSLDDLLF